MALDNRQKQAAKLLGEGATNRQTAHAVNLSESTILRWKRLDEFKELVAKNTPKGKVVEALSSQAENMQALELAKESEIILATELRELLERLSEVIGKRLSNLDDDEISEIPIRLLPTLFNAFTQGIETLQTGHDRLSGYKLILDELSKILDVKAAANLN